LEGENLSEADNTECSWCRIFLWGPLGFSQGVNSRELC
jgi:hypothetical protein